MWFRVKNAKMISLPKRYSSHVSYSEPQSQLNGNLGKGAFLLGYPARDEKKLRIGRIFPKKRNLPFWLFSFSQLFNPTNLALKYQLFNA